MNQQTIDQPFQTGGGKHCLMLAIYHLEGTGQTPIGVEAVQKEINRLIKVAQHIFKAPSRTDKDPVVTDAKAINRLARELRDEGYVSYSTSALDSVMQRVGIGGSFDNIGLTDKGREWMKITIENSPLTYERVLPLPNTLEEVVASQQQGRYH